MPISGTPDRGSSHDDSIENPSLPKGWNYKRDGDQAAADASPFSPKQQPNYTGSDATSDKAPDWLTKDLSKDNKLPWQKYFDPSVTDTSDPNSIAGRMFNRTDYAKSAGSGVDEAGHSFSFNQPGNQLTGGGKSPQSAAINRKYEADLGNKLQGMQSKREEQAPMESSQNLTKLGSLLGAQQKNEQDNFSQQYAFQQQRYQLYQQWRAAVNANNAAFTQQAIGAGVAVGSAVIG